ncbi:hypothetical protein ACJ7Z2_00535 [Mannheimia glucosida]|uniref:hypothetical protein n=1 Tax=Mannheimia glucosida TaxID=85401 RepID=UPI003917B97F
MKENINLMLSWKYLPITTISVFLVIVIFFVGISLCKLFKHVEKGKILGFIIVFLLLVSQFLVLNNLLACEQIYKEAILYFSSIISIPIMIILFSTRDKTKNNDFIAIIGISIFMQAIISMMVSSSNDYSFNIKFIHGAWYISLPAFLIYEVSNHKKDFSEILTKLDFIGKNLKTNPNKSFKKLSKHKCKFFK